MNTGPFRIPDGGKSYVCAAGEAPLLGETIGDMFRRIAGAYPDHEALVYVPDNERYTYSELFRVCCMAAKSLLALGIKKGDRVAIWATNRPEWVITQFSTAMIGAVLVTINPAYRTHELEYGLKDSATQTLILIPAFKSSNYVEMLHSVVPELAAASPGRIESSVLPFLENVILISPKKQPGMFAWQEFMALGENINDDELNQQTNELDFDDIINIQYTSGTTGLPKGAALTHFNILNNGYHAGTGMRFSHNDRLCIPVPFYHCFGMVLGNLTCLTHGATIIIPDEYFEPKSVLETVQKERCTALHGVPTMFIAELALPEFKDYDLSSLRTGIMAGSPCPVEVMKRVNNEMNMHEVTIGYGQTETLMTVLNYHGMPLKPGSMGRPLPGIETAIYTEDGRIAGNGADGQLAIRLPNPQIMLHYWDDPDRTASQRTTIDGAEWFLTGDNVHQDEDGYIFFVGRADDIISSSGYRIGPQEVENALIEHPSVQESAVVGIADPERGEIVKAFVVLTDPSLASEALAGELQEHVKRTTAPYKYPRAVEFIDELPKTVSGKIRRNLLRERAR